MTEVVVSVVCTVFNKSKFLSQAIDSFLSQNTNFDFEILIIDDCSTDGSREIIENYYKKYPKKIKFFYNDINLGITKTWKKICDKASGKYIARCDGDDYWVDNSKLQKQVDYLESQSESKWCTTDFSIVNGDSLIVDEALFKTGMRKFYNTFEDVLVYKSFSAPSAWLVDRELMIRANNSVSDEAIDDTFNIQLELLRYTKLTLLPFVSVAYREIIGTDSRPTSDEQFRRRIKLLKETQQEYLLKYRDFDANEVISKMIELDYSQELRLHDLYQEVEQSRITRNEQFKVIDDLMEEIEIKNNTLGELNDIIAHIKVDNERLYNQYLSITSSRRWRFTTKFINLFRRKK